MHLWKPEGNSQKEGILNLRDRVRVGVEKYFNELRVPAGWLREKGWDLDDEIPDCATVPYSSIKISSKVVSREDGTPCFTLTKEITEPFEWVQVTLERENDV